MKGCCMEGVAWRGAACWGAAGREGEVLHRLFPCPSIVNELHAVTGAVQDDDCGGADGAPPPWVRAGERSLHSPTLPPP